MSSRREKLLQRIDPKLLEITPKLSSGNNSVIELDSEKDTLKAGAKDLMLRFFKKQELVFKNLAIEDGVDSNYQESYRLCRSISQRLSLPFSQEGAFRVEKPGKKLQELKKKLEEQMAEKRNEDYKKRVEDYKKWKMEQNQKENNESEEEEEEDEKEKITDEEDNFTHEKKAEFSEGSCSRDTAAQNESEDKIYNDDITGSEKNYKYDCKTNNTEDNNDNIGVANVALTKETYNWTNDNSACEDAYDEDSSSDKYSLVPPYQVRSATQCSAPEQTQCSQGLPPQLMSPSLRLAIGDSQCTKNSDVDEVEENSMNEKCRSSIFSNYNSFLGSQNKGDLYDLNEAFEFCSGVFPENDSPKTSKISVQSEASDSCSDEEADDELEGDCNGDVANNDVDEDENTEDIGLTKKNSESKKRIIVLQESDEESDIRSGCAHEDEKTEGDEEQKLRPVRIISDDEEDSENIVESKIRKAKILNFSDDETSNDGKDSKDDGDEEEDDDDDDDDDDDRKSVFYDSEENEITNAREFFEREAELSGSEYSGDEDERGLDEFDAEAGDEDDLDYDQIQSQLGRIHLRKLLDEDSRNVRLLQELLFEDGDLQVDANEKKFKWKNLANLEEKIEFNTSENRTDNVESSDEEDTEDLQARKERLENQLLFEKMKEKGELSFECTLFKNVFQKLKVTTIKKFLNAATNDKQNKKNTESNTNPTTTAVNPSVPQTTRGSFLSRNEELLSKLAKVTSAVTDNVRGPKNSKNFVFATKSPEKPKIAKKESKRPLTDSDSGSSKKKLKLSGNNYSVPSILDLMG